MVVLFCLVGLERELGGVYGIGCIESLVSFLGGLMG